MKLDLSRLKAGVWDEAQAREYIQRVQWAAQRVRSIDGEVNAIYVRFEEPMNDGYLFNRDEKGRSRSLLLEATVIALARPRVLPVDLANIATMAAREWRVLVLMASAEHTAPLEALELAPQFGWLDAEG